MFYRKEHNMAMVETQEQIESIAREAGEVWGYKTVKVKTNAFKDFKVRWVRTVDTIEFSVTDYLVGMPEEAVRGFFKGIFSKIRGTNEGFGTEFNECVTSQEFLDRCREIYLRRNRVNGEPYQTVDDDVKVYFKTLNMQVAVESCVIFRTIFLNERLKDAPKEILDAIIDDTYNTVQDGRSQFGVECSGAYVEPEKLIKAEEYVKGLGMRW